MERVQNVYSFKGGKAVAMTMEIINYIASPYVNTTHRTVIGALLRAGVYDRGSALGIDEITELAAYSDRDYVGKALGSLTVSQLVIQFRSKDRKKKFYLNRDFASPIGKTVLPESQIVKQEPSIKKEKKLTPPKKPSGDLQKLLEYTEQYVGKVKLSQGLCINLNKCIKDFGLEKCKQFADIAAKDSFWNAPERFSLNSIYCAKNIDKWQVVANRQEKFKAEEKKVNATPRNISDAEMNFLE
jgi:hypothetical protein